MYFPRLFVYLVARLFRETEPLWSWRVAPCSLFVHFTRNFSLTLWEFYLKKKKIAILYSLRERGYKLDLGRCRTSPLCRRKNSRDTPSIFYLKKLRIVAIFRYSFFFANYFSFSIFIYLLFFFSFSLRDAHPRSRFRSRSSIDHGLWFQIFPRVAHLTSISSHLSRAFVIPASTPLFPPLVRTLHGPSSFLVFPSSGRALFSPVFTDMVVISNRGLEESIYRLFLQVNSVFLQVEIIIIIVREQ